MTCKVALNPRLVASQKLTAADIAKITALHAAKYKLIQRMRRAKKPETLKTLAWQVTETEYELQKAWGFPTDSKWHRFWELPKCSCGSLDNSDAWPTGHYSISGDCPIHGGEV